MTADKTLFVDGVKIIKSPKRKRTVAWRWLDGLLTVRVPERFTKQQIDSTLQQIRAREQGTTRKPRRDDKALRQEAEQLNQLYFDGKLLISSIRYATMHTRRGSCSIETAEIRISTSLASVPDWVRHAVIHHELCHLVEANHGPAFKALESRYPLRAQASDYLKLLERGDATRIVIAADERTALADLLTRTGALPEVLARLS